MPTKERLAARRHRKVIEEDERFDDLAQFRWADQTRNRPMRLATRPMHDGARRGQSLQYGAHAAIAAMRSCAFAKAVSRASGLKANPSARTTVTSVNPMKVRMLVR
jgi:hypothetical protein